MKNISYLSFTLQETADDKVEVHSANQAFDGSVGHLSVNGFRFSVPRAQALSNLQCNYMQLIAFIEKQV